MLKNLELTMLELLLKGPGAAIASTVPRKVRLAIIEFELAI
jgi:hypothetical protein